MIIDAHVHFWKYNAARDAWMKPMPALQKDHLPGELGEIFSGNGVQGCVAVQAEQSEAETFFLADLASNYSFIKGVVGWIDLRNRNIEERLDFFSKDSFIKGWRHIVQAEPDDFLLDAAFQNGIRSLASHNFTYDVLIYPRQMASLLQLLSKFPDQKFVIDHCAKPNIASGEIKVWAGMLKEVSQHSNVSCKLSGLVTEAKQPDWQSSDLLPYLDVVFDSFGCRRILFGSDWPVLTATANYIQWKKIVEDFMDQVSPQQKQQVFRENAKAFYSL